MYGNRHEIMKKKDKPVKPLKGLRFEELYEFFKSFKPEDIARKQANQQIKFQNNFYKQDEYHE